MINFRQLTLTIARSTIAHSPRRSDWRRVIGRMFIRFFLVSRFSRSHAPRGNAGCVALATRDAERPCLHFNGDRWNEDEEYFG